MTFFKLFHRHAKSPGCCVRNSFNIQRLAQIYDHNLLSGV